MSEMIITTPDALKVIDQAKRLDELEDKLKMVEIAKSVIECELQTMTQENEELRRINRKYRAERQAARERGEQMRLQGEAERPERIKTALLCTLIGASIALAIVTAIIWVVGV